jgi:hypothetical protein
MIWLTWRQHRGEALVIGMTLAALAILMIVTGREIYDSYTQLGVAACLANTSTLDPNCGTVINNFLNQFGFLRAAVPWLNLVPLLVAMLVGAPLVARELEGGTYRMVWTQGVTRLRWLTVKLALVIAGCLLAEGVMIALLTWWGGPFTRLNGSFSTDAFDLEGTAPLAYMAFSLAVAVTSGTLLRRALPAMALTIALFMGVRLPVDTWIRPHYQAPITRNFDLVSGASLDRQDWVINSGFVDSQGRSVDFIALVNACDPNSLEIGSEKQSVFQCAQDHGFQERVVYQPANRLATFQAIETALYLVVTAGLLGLTVFWVRRRVS